MVHRKFLYYKWAAMNIKQPGLGHMSLLLRSLLWEASRTGRVALLPPLLINPMHNRGISKVSTWSRYFDLSRGGVLELSHELAEQHVRSMETETCAGHRPVSEIAGSDAPCLVKVFKDSNILGQWLPGNWRDEASGFIGYPKSIRRMASVIASRYGPFDVSLHVRRNDIADKRTSPGAVVDYLTSMSVHPHHRILLCSDERNTGYYRQLRKEFPYLLCEHEIDELRQLWSESRDNYLIFRISTCIRECESERTLPPLRYLDAKPGAARKMRIKLQREIHNLRQRLGGRQIHPDRTKLQH